MTERLTEGLAPISNEQHPDLIAGIIPVHISDEPPYSFHNDQFGGHVGVIESRYAHAQQTFNEEGFVLDNKSLWDDRFSMLYLEDGKQVSPVHAFLVTQHVLRDIKAARDAKEADLSQDELLAICLKNDEGAVDSDFKTDAMNAINASYFASEIAFDASANLATMFVANKPLNVAIGSLIARNTIDSSPVRIKEISSGSNTGHWQQIVQAITEADNQKQVELTLTDFVTPTIAPELAMSDLAVKAETYSLFDDLPELPSDARFDAILATYGFDSVWQPEDVKLSLIHDQWYRTAYRVKVADWALRRDELVRAMRQGKPLPQATAKDYDGIVVETAMEPIDLTEHPYHEHIIASEQKTVLFPGGLIKRVVNAFQTQLHDKGIFISGDTGNFGFHDPKKYFIAGADACTSGVAARYRLDDYVLAKQILENVHGLDVALIGLGELAGKYLPDDWRQDCLPNEQRQIDDLPTNGIMLVKRKTE